MQGRLNGAGHSGLPGSAQAGAGWRLGCPVRRCLILPAARWLRGDRLGCGVTGANVSTLKFFVKQFGARLREPGRAGPGRRTGGGGAAVHGGSFKVILIDLLDDDGAALLHPDVMSDQQPRQTLSVDEDDVLALGIMGDVSGAVGKIRGGDEDPLVTGLMASAPTKFCISRAWTLLPAS